MGSRKKLDAFVFANGALSAGMAYAFNDLLHPDEIPEGGESCYDDLCYTEKLNEVTVGAPEFRSGQDIYEFVNVHPQGEIGKFFGKLLNYVPGYRVSGAGTIYEHLTVHKLGVFTSKVPYQKFSVTYRTIWPRENSVFQDRIFTESRPIGPPVKANNKPYRFD